LVDGLGAGLDGGDLGQLEHPRHLYRPVAGFGAVVALPLITAREFLLRQHLMQRVGRV
jgi:glucokinase